jgi:hypothetical protein
MAEDKEVFYRGKERRRRTRWRGNVPCELVFFSDLMFPFFSKHIKGVVRNVSAVGLCVEIGASDAVEIETSSRETIKVGLKFRLVKGAKEIKAIARIVWMRKILKVEQVYMLGMEFIDITTVSQDVIVDNVINFYLNGGKSRKNARITRS